MATAQGAVEERRWCFLFFPLLSQADPRRVTQSHRDLLALFDKVLLAPGELQVV